MIAMVQSHLRRSTTEEGFSAHPGTTEIPVWVLLFPLWCRHPQGPAQLHEH